MSKNGCDLPQEVREDVIPLTNPEIENLVDGVDFQDHFEGLEKMTNLVDGGDFQHHIEGLERRADLVDGDDFQDNLRADLVDGDDFQDILRADLADGVNFQDHFEGLERADLVNDNSSDSDFAQYVEDDVESNAPSEALDDIEGSDNYIRFPTHPSSKPSKPKRKARRRRTSNVNETTRRRTSNVNEATGQEANNHTAATPQTRNPLNAATHEAANSTPAAATRLSNNQPTSVHQNPLLAAIQNAYTPTAAIRQLGVNPRLAVTHETMPTEDRGQVYEGRRNAALLGTSNWKDLQQAQSISTSQAASDGQNVQKRIRKPIDIQVLQNIRESSKKRIWKP